MILSIVLWKERLMTRRAYKTISYRYRRPAKVNSSAVFWTLYTLCSFLQVYILMRLFATEYLNV